VGALALTVSSLSAAILLAAVPAQAAPGDAFPAADPLVFVAQGLPTGLYQAVTDASGTTNFEPEGPAADLNYNAIAYNPADNYIYALTTSANETIPAAALIRIGQDGEFTRVGEGTYTGSVSATFGPGGLYYTYANVEGVVSLQVIDVATGAVVRVTPITGELAVGNDMAFKDGFLWTMGSGLISRTNPETGATVRFELPFPTSTVAGDQGGAAWTFGNGNLGFSYNASGTVYQVAVSDAAGAAPTFTLVSSNPGPLSSNNDGTASPGLPTDLALVKTGPAATVPAGGTVTYTLTVTNNGPGNSSGFVVNDSLPAPLTDVTTDSDGCTVTGNDVQCVGGRLVGGDFVSYTITATVPAGVTAAIDNTATVTANEQDPVPVNNSSTSTALPSGIAVVKNAGTPVDVNGNGLVDAGDTIQYTFDVTNTGEATLSEVTVDDPLVGAVICPTTTLAGGDTVTCSAERAYTITSDDVSAGSVDNTATVTGSTPDGETLTSTPSETSTETTAPAPAMMLVKSADAPAEPLAPGDVITYHFVLTNTGNVPLNDIAVQETEFSGTGPVPVADCPVTTLAPSEQTTCEATYTLTAADVDAGEVTNTATGIGTPAGETTPITTTPSEAAITTPAAPGLEVVKTADPETIVSAGQDVTYSFRLTNTGNVTLTDVAPVEVGFSGTGELSAITCPTTTLVAGQFTTCTATYEVTQEDVDAGSLTNAATAEGTTPNGDPVPTPPPSETVVDIPRTSGLSIVKSADAESVEVGQTITYSFLVTNTGNVTVTDPAVTDTEFSGAGDLSAIDCPAGALAPGEDITCTATYTVEQADVDAGSITNVATVDGSVPDGVDPIDDVPSNEVVVDTDPQPALTLTKTADVEQIGEVGEVVTYSFLLENTGNVTITDAQIDDSGFTGGGELSPITCPADTTLAPGESVTCTATYTVVAADLEGDAGISNTAVGTGTTPAGGLIESAASTVVIDEEAADPPAEPTDPPVQPSDPPAQPEEPNAQPSDPAAQPEEPNPSQQDEDLVATGGDPAGWLTASAIALLLGGGVLVAARRQTTTRSQD
jgi:uncharacterized repeat protein (TIGR01451 family)